MRWGICIIKFNWFNKLLNSLTFIMLSAICISIKSYRYTISQQVFRPFNRLHVFLQHCFLAIVTNSSLSLPSFCYSNRIFEIINSSKIQFLFCSLVKDDIIILNIVAVRESWSWIIIISVWWWYTKENSFKFKLSIALFQNVYLKQIINKMERDTVNVYGMDVKRF